MQANLQLLEAIDKSNDDALKQEALSVLKSTVDSSMTSLLEKSGTQISPRWDINQITSTLLDLEDKKIPLERKFSYAVEVFKDLQGTPTSTSWFLNLVVDFINQIGGGG